MAVVVNLSKGYDLDSIWTQMDRDPAKDAASYYIQTSESGGEPPGRWRARAQRPLASATGGRIERQHDRKAGGLDLCKAAVQRPIFAILRLSRLMTFSPASARLPTVPRWAGRPPAAARPLGYKALLAPAPHATAECKGWRIVYGAFIVAFTGFAIAGYLVPISWTGFSDQRLWNWIELLVLPAALAIAAALTGRRIRYQGRLLRPYEQGMVIALAAGWIVTVIGGYALRWTWTGYSGNTLWDWLQMLLVPLVFPTILLPFLLKWVSGNAAKRAAMAHEAPVVPSAVVTRGATL